MIKKFFKSIRTVIILLVISSTFFAFSLLEEGMFPLSEISKLDLKKAGLKIDVNKVYNPKGISLVDALVDVGGCTGSFISENGLILTNHHCAFGAVQAASSVENDYITNGFLAKTQDQEIEANGMLCRIIESYEDVSQRVLDHINKFDNFLERNKELSKITNEIKAEAEKKDTTIEANVSEMFPGKTYILFRYKVLRDVRLVYVPPRNIGEFGGEEDNWVWPRHNADFAIVRAYVSPNGTGARFSKNNIPFKPKNFLKINPNGINENDFVFILGYPGRTFRHQPSQFLKFHRDIQLPYISDLFSWQISEFEKISKESKELEIQLAGRIKSLANTEKNYRGKIQGFDRLKLVDRKIEEEKNLEEFINKDEKLKNKYGNVLTSLNNVYEQIYNDGKRNLIVTQINRASSLIYNYTNLYEFLIEKNKAEKDRKSPYKNDNLEKTKKNIINSIVNTNKRIEKLLLTRLFNDALELSKSSDIPPINELVVNKENIEQVLINIFNSEELFNSKFIENLLNSTADDFSKTDNKFLVFIKKFYDLQEQINKENQERQGAINKYSAELLEVKQLWQKKNFIPDANSTLRLTYGYVKGYSPADAVYYSPFTTLKGLIEKSYKGGVYQLNPKIKALYDKKDYGRYINKKYNDLTLAFIYNLDTTGGNSGSPVMNAFGELVGLNFDRAFEATINDYAWSDLYSRSIGVDVRFILWVLDKVAGADNVLKELNIKN